MFARNAGGDGLEWALPELQVAGRLIIILAAVLDEAADGGGSS